MGPSSPLPLRRGAGGGRQGPAWRPHGREPQGAREARAAWLPEGDRSRPSAILHTRAPSARPCGGRAAPSPTARQGEQCATIRTGWRRVRYPGPALRMRDASTEGRGVAARPLRCGQEPYPDRTADGAAGARQGRTPAGPRPLAGSVHDGPLPMGPSPCQHLSRSGHSPSVKLIS